MEIKVPKHLKELWEEYAENAGIPLEYLMIQSIQYFIKNDKLGVNEGKVKELESKAKILEWQKRIDIVQKGKPNNSTNKSQEKEKKFEEPEIEPEKTTERQNNPVDLPFEEINLEDLQ